MVAIIAGASATVRPENTGTFATEPVAPVAEEPSRRDRILDAVTERGMMQIRAMGREAPEDGR